MVVVSDLGSAQKRIGIGLGLLRRACIDAARGIFLVSTGLALAPVEACSSVWLSLRRVWSRRGEDKRPQARSIERLGRGLSRLSRLAGPGLILILVMMVAMWGEGWEAVLPMIGQLLMLAAIIGIVALMVFALRGLAGALGSVFSSSAIWSILRVGFSALPVIGVGAVGFLAISNLGMPPVWTLLAGASVLAVASGIAVVSLGGARWSLVSYAGRSGAPAQAATIDVDFETVQPRAILRPRATLGAPEPRRSDHSRRKTWIAAGIAGALLALAGAYLASLVPIKVLDDFALSAELSPRASGERATMAQAPSSSLNHLALLIDGVAGEVAWRRGYRSIVVPLNQTGSIAAFGLDGAACEAELVLAAGSASSDGASAANVRLALARAVWLGEWANAQLASCGSRPAVVAVSTGQSDVSPASAGQRRLQLFTLGRSDVWFAASQRVADASGDLRSTLADLGAVEACTVVAGNAARHGLPADCQ